MSPDRVFSAHERFGALISILLFFACLGMGGAAAVRFRHRDVLMASSFAGAAVMSAFLTAPYWARVLPGILGVAALNSMFTFCSGHQIGADVPASRANFATCMVAFLAAAILAREFGRGNLGVLVRALLVGGMAALLLGMVRDAVALPAVAGMISFISLASVLHRSRSGERTGSYNRG